MSKCNSSRIKNKNANGLELNNDKLYSTVFFTISIIISTIRVKRFKKNISLILMFERWEMKKVNHDSFNYNQL